MYIATFQRLSIHVCLLFLILFHDCRAICLYKELVLTRELVIERFANNKVEVILSMSIFGRNHDFFVFFFNICTDMLHLSYSQIPHLRRFNGHFIPLVDIYRIYLYDQENTPPDVVKFPSSFHLLWLHQIPLITVNVFARLLSKFLSNR